MEKPWRVVVLFGEKKAFLSVFLISLLNPSGKEGEKMKEENKSVITRRMCEKFLIGEALAHLPAIIISFLLSCVLCLLLPGLFDDAPPLYAWMMAFISLALVLLCAYLLFDLIRRIFLAKKGRFAIVEDTLTALAEEEKIYYYKRHARVRIEHVFYFEKHGRYVTTPLDGSQYDYSNCGDQFYVLILGIKRSRVMRAFNTRVYTYRP
jgi:hypothetical protein